MTAPSAAERAIDLLPCPFCGAEAYSGAKRHGFQTRGMTFIGCLKCGFFMPVMRNADAAEAWNRRTALATARAAVWKEAIEAAAFLVDAQATVLENRDPADELDGKWAALRESIMRETATMFRETAALVRALASPTAGKDN
jgi:Lar family restriction alleviation protein